jgi:hypothetical protein
MVASVSAVDAVPDMSASSLVAASPALAVACASLGILGGKAYAMVGADLAEGKSVFVAVRARRGEALHEAQRRAAYEALEQLEERLGRPLIYFWTPYPPVASAGK